MKAFSHFLQSIVYNSTIMFKMKTLPSIVFLSVFVNLICFSGRSLAIDEVEVVVLNAMLDSWPILSQHGWTKNMTTICDLTSPFIGITCLYDHIFGMYACFLKFFFLECFPKYLGTLDLLFVSNEY